MFAKLSCLALSIIFQINADSADLDFEQDVLPIFQQHCVDCHCDGNTEGDLSLDSLAAVQRGGHSGSPLLSAELNDSELYLRITSDTDGYRMPKKGEPLSKQEIDTLGSWITQAAASTVVPQVRRTVDQPETTAIFDGLSTRQLMTFTAAGVIVLLLLGWMFYRSVAANKREKEIAQPQSRLKSFVGKCIVLLLCLALVALAYFYFRTGRLVEENESLRAQLQQLQPSTPPVIEVSSNNLPLPPHPMHPSRLGGQYYRGNDERDDSLFNRGFYRTATIDVHLVDTNGNRLERGAEVSEDLAIEIVIQRAPKATKELFSERVLKMVSLQHYCQSVPTFKESMSFTVVEQEDLWKAVVPIPKRDQWNSQDQAQGMIYMMYGVQPGPQQSPRPHFAIRYDLEINDVTISDESELWMGSMYTLGNRVLVPDDDKILLDRWFDWRPIPVIEGDAATDKKLLGVDEHLDN